MLDRTLPAPTPLTACDQGGGIAPVPRPEHALLDILAFFHFVNGVLEQALAASPQPPRTHFHHRVAGLATQIATSLSRYWSHYPEAARSQLSATVQAELNGIVERTVARLSAVGAWKFLPQIRFVGLSPVGTWQMLCMLVRAQRTGHALLWMGRADVVRLTNTNIHWGVVCRNHVLRSQGSIPIVLDVSVVSCRGDCHQLSTARVAALCMRA